VIEQVKSFEYHVDGQPVRVIVEGVPVPQGTTQAQKAAWFGKHADRYRKGVVLPPRGHHDMTAVLLTEASSPGAHAGLVFLDANGYPRLATHGVMAAVSAAMEHDLIFARDAASPGGRFVFDTPAGLVTARAAEHDGNSARHLLVEAVPAFVHTPACKVALPGRTVVADLAFGGEFYALVDGEAAQVPLDAEHVPELRRLGRAVCAAVNASLTVAHPEDPSLEGVAGTIFTGPAREERAHLRSVAVSAAGVVDWSPSGGGMTAVLAVLDAMGLLEGAPAFANEGLSGTVMTGRVVSRTSVGDRPALVVEIAGDAWATGEQTWLFDHDDPFRQGVPTTALPGD
jgi:proline racemase